MKRNQLIVILILFIWFIISFVTNILGPMLPMIISDFHLSLTLAAFLPFSFFLAYGIMSIPAGMIIERYGGKKSLLIAFAFAFSGTLLYVLFPTYFIVLTSLFIIGLGMAMLQVIILPLMREAGGEKNYAFYSVLAQVVFGSASFISPFALTALLHQLTDPRTEATVFIVFLRKMVPADLPWSSFYLIFTIVFALMLFVIVILKFPRVTLKEDEKAGTLRNYKDLLKNKYVILFFSGNHCLCGYRTGIGQLDEPVP